MKNPVFACLRTSLTASLRLAVYLVLSPIAEGGTHVWIGPAGGVWSNPANWSGGIPVTGEAGGTLVVFGTSSVSACNYSLTVDQITFNGGNNVITNGGGVLSVNGAAATENIWSMAAGNAIAAPIQYVGSSTIFVRSDAGTLTLANTISGTTNSRKRGVGTVSLTAAANTNTGVTSVAEGTLLLDSPGSSTCIVGDLVVGDGSTAASLVLNQALEIKDTSNVTVNAAASFVMNSFSDTINNLTVAGGSVSFTTATLTLAGSLSMTGGSISGTSGSLALQGDVTATSSATSTATISSLITLSATRTFTVNDGAQANDLTLSNAISGASAGLIKNGAGTLLLSTGADNTYGGGTTVNQGTVILNGFSASVIPGTLIIGNGTGAAGSVIVRLGQGVEINDASNVSVKSDGLLDVAGFQETIAQLDIDRGSVTMSSGVLNAGPIIMSGGSIASGSGALFVRGNVTATSTATSAATMLGAVYLAGDRTFTVNPGGSAPHLTINGVVNGTTSSAGLIKAGTGTMLLKGAVSNVYTGTTTVSLGTLQLMQSSGTTINGPLVIGNAIDPAGSAVVQEIAGDDLLSSIPVTINKSGVLDLNGQSDVIDGLSGEGHVLLTGAFSQLAVGSANGSANFAGTMGGGGVFIKTGTGTQTLSGKLTSPLSRLLAGTGTLIQKFGAGTAFADVVQAGDGVGAAGSAILDLSAADQLSPTGSIEVKVDGQLKANSFDIGASTVNIDRGSINVPSGTFTAGNITMSGGAITGAGSLRLTGDIIATSVAAGGASVATKVILGDIRLITVNPGAVTPDLTISGAIQDASPAFGGFTKKGTGTMRLASTTNSFFGTTTVDRGNLELNNTLGLAIGGPLVIGNNVDPANSAVVKCLTSFMVGGATPITINASGKYDVNGFSDRAGTLSGTGPVTMGAGNLNMFGSGDATYDGIISGAGGLTKSGTGTQIFTQNNTYAGGTFINGGKLVINGTQSGTVTVGAAGSLGGIGTVDPALNANTAGARVAPGSGIGTNLGVFHVNGNANLSNGKLVVRLNGATTLKSDKLVVSGDLNVTGATVVPIPMGPVAGTSHVIATYGGNLIGTFASSPPGCAINYAYNDGISFNNIALTVSDPWQAWLAGYGLNPAGNGLPDADPDGDGIPNGIEFVIGTDPTLRSSLDGLPSGILSGGNYVFSFRRAGAAATSHAVVQTSTTLSGAGAWTEVVAGITVDPNFYAPGIDRVSATISRAGKPTLFCRLMIDGL